MQAVSPPQDRLEQVPDAVPVARAPVHALRLLLPRLFPLLGPLRQILLLDGRRREPIRRVAKHPLGPPCLLLSVGLHGVLHGRQGLHRLGRAPAQPLPGGQLGVLPDPAGRILAGTVQLASQRGSRLRPVSLLQLRK